MKRYARVIIIIWFALVVVGVGTDQNQDRRADFFLLNKESEIQKILQEMSFYRNLGLISQLDKDMGDTLQRTGSYYTLLYFLGADRDDLNRKIELGFNQDMNALTFKDGLYRRSNDPDYWGYDFRNCSRDQLFAAQSAIVTFRDFKRGRNLFYEFFKRGFLNQNTHNNWEYQWDPNFSWKLPDIPTPSQLSLLFRGIGSPYLYPIIFFLDIFILVDIKIFRSYNERELWDYDIKQIPGLIAANSYLPTAWSRWGLDIYIQERSDIAKRIDYYNLEKFNGIRPLAKLYGLALEKLASADESAVSNNTVSQRFEPGIDDAQE